MKNNEISLFTAVDVLRVNTPQEERGFPSSAHNQLVGIRRNDPILRPGLQHPHLFFIKWSFQATFLNLGHPTRVLLFPVEVEGSILVKYLILLLIPLRVGSLIKSILRWHRVFSRMPLEPLELVNRGSHASPSLHNRDDSVLWSMSIVSLYRHIGSALFRLALALHSSWRGDGGGVNEGDGNRTEGSLQSLSLCHEGQTDWLCFRVILLLRPIHPSSCQCGGFEGNKKCYGLNTCHDAFTRTQTCQ